VGLNPFLLGWWFMIINFLSACALVFVLEGMIPFALPEQWKKLLVRVIKQDNNVLRISGLFSMLVGIVFLTIIHQFAG
jgi:uncharacterized protein YjeT (DUF2065 family)